jgi:hypothetical protein
MRLGVFTPKQLEIDTSDADEYMVQVMADEAVAAGEFSSWDHAYESLWAWVEYALDMQRKDLVRNQH